MIHKVRPSKLPKEMPKCYHQDDIIDPSQLSLPVKYSTYFTSSGIGMRSLTASELISCFGFISWNNESAPPPIPPLQILEIAIRTIPTSNSSHHLAASPCWLPTNVPAPTDSSWLPLVNCNLSHSWMQIPIEVSKAVKRDDAKVPISLWNQRCINIFPHHTPASLDLLRKYIQNKQVRILCLEILAF